MFLNCFLLLKHLLFPIVSNLCLIYLSYFLRSSLRIKKSRRKTRKMINMIMRKIKNIRTQSRKVNIQNRRNTDKSKKQPKPRLSTEGEKLIVKDNKNTN